jgi:hypothetical protein
LAAAGAVLGFFVIQEINLGGSHGANPDEGAAPRAQTRAP